MPSETGSALRALANITAAGMVLALSVGIGVGGGWWLDQKFGTEPWIMIGLGILGIAAGFLNFFKIVQRGTKTD